MTGTFVSLLVNGRYITRATQPVFCKPTFPGRINDRHYNDSAPPSLKLEAAQILEERHMSRLPGSTVSTHEVRKLVHLLKTMLL